MIEAQQTLNGDIALSPGEAKKQEKEFVDKMMDVVGSFTRPIIVMPGYTDMELPVNIKSAIQIERLILAKDGIKMASLTECAWYISTASLCAPPSHEWTNIMMYCMQNSSAFKSEELPDFLQEKIELEPYMEQLPLRELREWIYKSGQKRLK